MRSRSHAAPAMSDPQMRKIRELFDAAEGADREALLELADARVDELIERLPPDPTWPFPRVFGSGRG